MAMMDSGRRGLGPDEIPPVFYFILFFMVAFCVAALLVNYIHRPKNNDGSDVVGVYEQMVRSRVKGRTPYIANYLDKKKSSDEDRA